MIIKDDILEIAEFMKSSINRDIFEPAVMPSSALQGAYLLLGLLAMAEQLSYIGCQLDELQQAASAALEHWEEQP